MGCRSIDLGTLLSQVLIADGCISGSRVREGCYGIVQNDTLSWEFYPLLSTRLSYGSTNLQWIVWEVDIGVVATNVGFGPRASSTNVRWMSNLGSKRKLRAPHHLQIFTDASGPKLPFSLGFITALRIPQSCYSKRTQCALLANRDVAKWEINFKEN